jgi:hypothetical protein
MKTKPGRIPCVVPFCKRTARRQEDDEDGAEIICGRHGRAVDRRLRLLMRAVNRRVRKLEVCEANRAEWERLAAISHRTWAKMKVQAIERNAGIS